MTGLMKSIIFSDNPLQAAREEMDRQFKIVNTERHSPSRKYHYTIMLDIYNCEVVPEIKEEWILNKEEYHVINRFKKVGKTVKNIDSYKKVSGLYLIGNTYFNPLTKEEFYWVKVGQSTDIAKRLRNYRQHNPMVWVQNILELPIDELDFAESICHYELSKVSEEIGKNTREWFRVSRETYLKICTEEWNYFKSLKKLNIF